jgi:hypothetical protein
VKPKQKLKSPSQIYTRIENKPITTKLTKITKQKAEIKRKDFSKKVSFFKLHTFCPLKILDFI